MHLSRVPGHPERTLKVVDITALKGMEIEGRYRLGACRGSGSFGTVYEADEILRGKRIARCCLKLLLPESDDEPELLREIGHMARLAHPRIIAYRGCGEVREGPLAGSLYLAMERAERSLRTDLERGALAPGELLVVVQALAEGLNFLHGRGIVHRDVKPDNLLYVEGGWKLSDFGLTRTLKSLARLGPLPGGTAEYMAPEIFSGRIGPEVDLWALGVIVQEALTDQFPYPDSEVVDLRQYVLWHDPVVESELLDPFGWLARGCLQTDPSLRLSPSEVLETLGYFRASRPLAGGWLDECDRLVFRGSYEAALNRLGKLVVLDPAMTESVAGRYDQLLHLGLPDDLMGRLHLDLGRLWLASGHLEPARQILEDGRRRFPETPGLLLALGECYRRALPPNAEVLELVAGLYEQNAQPRQAVGAYRELLAMLSGKPRSRILARLNQLGMV